MWYGWNKKEVIVDHIHCQNDILKISESTAKATVETEQEIFGEGKFENVDVVIKTYDHSKTINYYDKEVKNNKLKEENLFKIKQKNLFKTTKKNW